MSTSDKIQLAIAIVAGVAAVLTFVNIYFTGQQIRIQKSQWEFIHSPVFKISYMKSFSNKKTHILFENINNVFHQIRSVHFSDRKVSVSFQTNGRIKNTKRSNGEITEERLYEGFQVILTPPDGEEYRGHLTLFGVDAIGNHFSARAESMIIINGTLQNEMQLKNSFLIKE